MAPATDAALIDPKLLLLFEALYRIRNVTRAAHALGQEQPTVSVWLAKLRRRFDDPLFVRTSSGMQPTPRADALVASVRTALERLRAVGGNAPSFDANNTERPFRVCMTDAAHITMLPPLLARLRAAAPGTALDVDYLSASTAEALRSGDADLALGFLPSLGAGFYQQALYAQDFVCLVNARHPRIQKSLGARQYRDEAHIGLALEGTGHAVVDRAMARQHVRRRVLLRLPGFLGLAAIVSTTDLIATVPRQLGETLAAQAPLRLFECPIRIPSYLVRQHWHERYHHDPASRWLRALVAGTFGARHDAGSIAPTRPPR
jgi:DNA-binding transcriptional LysR family regulator